MLLTNMFKTYVFIDFETTGLHDNPEVTEFCALAIDRDYPERIRNKLVICCRPPTKRIEPDAETITGIRTSMVSKCIAFSECFDTIYHFLSGLPQPICMLAHNGDNYDYKILDRELPQLNVECRLDTIVLFREIEHEAGIFHKMYSLGTVYKRLFGENAPGAHGSEVDCETLAKCFVKLRCIEYIERVMDSD